MTMLPFLILLAASIGSQAAAALDYHGGAFASLFTPEAEASKETMWACAEYGAYADVCVYRRLCVTGTQSLTFLLDKPENHARPSPVGMRMSTKLPWSSKGAVSRLRSDRLVPAYFPSDHLTFAKPSTVASYKPHWVKDRLFVLPSYREQLGNIWFYSSHVLPLFTMSSTLGRSLGVPRFDNADVMMFGPLKKVTHDYHKKVLNLTLPATARTFYTNTTDPVYSKLMSESGGMVCTDTAVLTGAQVFGFESFITADAFRRLAYQQANLSAPSKPVDDVIIIDRDRHKPRHIANPQALVDMVQSFGYEGERVIIGNDHTFEYQVQLMARAGILICVHGAGLMNTIYMQPGSVVIEIFPVHVKHVLYERVAHYAGVYHFKVYSKVFAKNFNKLHPQYLAQNCDRLQSLSVPSSGPCWPLVKNSNVVVPLEETREALVQAMDFIKRFRDPKFEAAQESK